MAIPIATIPTLTGEAAERFEAAAEKAYQAYLYREEHPDSEEAIRWKKQYEKAMKMVDKILANSNLDE